MIPSAIQILRIDFAACICALICDTSATRRSTFMNRSASTRTSDTASDRNPSVAITSRSSARFRSSGIASAHAGSF